MAKIERIDDLDELQRSLTQGAQEIAENYNETLDFSHASVQGVERILADIHKHRDEYLKRKDGGGLNGIALSFSAYIITTMERNGLHGTLQRDDPNFGPNTFPYTYKEGTLYPYQWCLKRVMDGPGDDVWSKYQTLILKPENIQLDDQRPWYKKLFG